MSSDNPIIVVKMGGAALQRQDAVALLFSEVQAIERAGYRVVLCHGGGPEIDAMLGRLHIEPRKHRGLRITDAETLDIVESVLSGRINGHLVGEAQRAGMNPVGLSGKDGKLLTVQKKAAEVDLGFVGTVTSVNAEVLYALLEAGFTPIVACIGVDDKGQSYNINGDEAASAIASALQAHAFFLLTDVAGIFADFPDPASRYETISRKDALLLIDSGKADKGMIPKIEAAVSAVASGSRVVVLQAGIDGSLIAGLQGTVPNGTVVTVE